MSIARMSFRVCKVQGSAKALVWRRTVVLRPHDMRPNRINVRDGSEASYIKKL